MLDFYKLIPRQLDFKETFCFAYCRFEDEIARLECPHWLIKDKERFDQGMSPLPYK